jgi:DtxR family Mn-dependent transcriptional regulator
LEAPSQVSESAEMYLKSIWELSASGQPLPIAELAGRLGISNVSATEMVHRMAAQQLLDHTPYRGVQLTDHGQERARAIVRRHRLWEVWLFEELGLPWDAVHELACSLEHAAPEAVTEAMARKLGNPLVCPHGNPIPQDPPSSYDLGRPLGELRPGQSARLRRIHPESAFLLQTLGRFGLKPGILLHLDSIDPLDDLFRLTLGDRRITLGSTMAGHLFVDVIDQDA